MEPIFSKSSKVNLENDFDPIILETCEIQRLDDKLKDKNIDVSTISIDELSSYIVSKLISDVRADLAKIKIALK